MPHLASTPQSSSPPQPATWPRTAPFATTLFTYEGARETEALLRFNEIWLKPESRFVVRDRVLKFTNTAKQIGQLFVDQSKVWIN